MNTNVVHVFPGAGQPERSPRLVGTWSVEFELSLPYFQHSRYRNSPPINSRRRSSINKSTTGAEPIVPWQTRQSYSVPPAANSPIAPSDTPTPPLSSELGKSIVWPLPRLPQILPSSYHILHTIGPGDANAQPEQPVLCLAGAMPAAPSKRRSRRSHCREGLSQRC